MRGYARRNARSVLPTSTTSKPRGRRCARGATQDDFDRIETLPSGLEGKPRFMPVLARQATHLARPDVGRIARDDIVRLTGKRREMVGLDEPHAAC